MSLQVWLPLNGNLNNYGIANVNVINNGATIDNNGKIGKCYNLTSGNYLGLDATNINKHKYSPISLAAWFYPTQNDSTERLILCCYESGGCGLSLINQKLGFQIYVSGWHLLQMPSAVSLNTWHHICGTYDETMMRLYIDGIEVATQAQTGKITYNSTTPWEIGGNPGPTSFGSGTIVGKINDVRIYNNVISAEEIKEIAKGLVGHWELGTYNVSNNLLHNAAQYTEHSPLIDTKNVVDGWREWPKLYYDHLEAGKTYILSCESDGTLVDRHGASYSADVKAFTMWLYLANYHNGTATGYSEPINFTSNNYSYTKIGNVHTWTYTLPANSTYTTCDIRTNIYSNGTDACTVKWWNIKLEESPYSQFFPTEEKLNRNIEYDISGYKRDMYLYGGTNISECLTNNLEKRHKLTYSFNNIRRFQAKSSFYRVNGDELTVCCWFYQTATGGYQDLVTCRGNATTNGGGSYNWMLYLHQTGNTLQLHGNAQYVSTISPTLNEWHFVVARVNSNETYDLFLDGEWVVTGQTYAYHTETILPSLTIGCYGGASEIFRGNITDVRIYGTALSNDDITELYNMGRLN